jgi:hypothetical protein
VLKQRKRKCKAHTVCMRLELSVSILWLDDVDSQALVLSASSFARHTRLFETRGCHGHRFCQLRSATESFDHPECHQEWKKVRVLGFVGDSSIWYVVDAMIVVQTSASLIYYQPVLTDTWSEKVPSKGGGHYGAVHLNIKAASAKLTWENFWNVHITYKELNRFWPQSILK